VFECGSKVFRWEWKGEHVLPSNHKACIECFICEIKCPHEAIKLTLREKPKAQAARAGR
jgi:NAD-dependent dihydropyrimidine dehydrogenase PreA subunit